MCGDDAVGTLARRDAEISLLQAMYPDDVQWEEKGREVRYSTGDGACLVLRLPDGYPGSELPTLISASDAHKHDVRTLVKADLQALDLDTNVEVCDLIIQAFNTRLENINAGSDSHQKHHIQGSSNKAPEYKTVVVWLHHLLATTKRKLALHPSLNSDEIVGVTKPGYPGVLLFAGPADIVDAHIAELKDQRWQAFQVRLEQTFTSEVDKWRFHHGTGIVEVETMSGVVQSIVGQAHQESFLHAVGVK